MIITYVSFNPDGDGVDAVYIDGKLHRYGDYYHDKFRDWYDGFLDGLRIANIVFSTEYRAIRNKKLVYNVVDCAGTPPGLLSELKGKR